MLKKGFYTIAIIILFIGSKSSYGRFLYLKEGKVFFKTYGYWKNKPIVFLHGGPGLSFRYMYKYFLPLKKRFFLFFFDQLGRGYSKIYKKNLSKKNRGYLFNIFTDVYILKVVKLRFFGYNRRINIVSHSFGTLTSLLFYIMYPEHVNKMVLLNPVPLSQRDRDTVDEVIGKCIDKFNLSKRLKYVKRIKNRYRRYKSSLLTILPCYFYDKRFLKNRFFKRLLIWGVGDPKFFYHLSRSLGNYELLSFFKRKRKNIMIIASAHDIFPIEVLNKYKRIVLDRNFIVLKNSGHFSFIEKQKTVLRYILNFLD